VITELLRNLNDNGVAYAIVCALSAWLGSLWAGRIGRREDNALQCQITELQAQLDREKTKLEGKVEKSVNVHKVQFEKEFTVYQELTLAAENLRVAFFTLRRKLLPLFDNDVAKKAYFKPLVEEFTNRYYTFRDSVYRNRPFFAKEVYAACDKLLDVLTKELIHQDFVPLHGQEMPDAEIQELKNKVKAYTNDLSDSIRSRIQSITIVE
jgi:hypothetical protein